MILTLRQLYNDREYTKLKLLLYNRLSIQLCIELHTSNCEMKFLNEYLSFEAPMT